jgi:hypothetical protein
VTPRTHRRLAAATIAAVALVHLALVLSIARQPFDVNRRPPDERAVIWPLHFDTVHRVGPGSDFFATYHAGVKLSRGESPYDHKEQPKVTPPFYPFRYLPAVAMSLGRGAAAIPPRAAYLAWILALELLLAATVALVWRSAPSLRWKLAYASALLLSSPYLLELHMGQFTFATLALLSLGAWQLDRGRAVSGSVAYALASLLKVVPLAALPALVRDRQGRHRHGRIAAAAAVAAVILTNAPYFLSYPADWTAFSQRNFGPVTPDGFHGGNYGLLYVLWKLSRELGLGGFATFATLWQLGVLGVTALLVFWRRPPMLTGALALMFAHMITYKHVWEHHASGAVVCAVFLLVRANAASWPGRWLIAACLLALVLPTPFALIDPLVAGQWDPLPSWSPAARYLLPMCKAIPALLLWISSLVLVIRSDLAPRSPS